MYKGLKNVINFLGCENKVICLTELIGKVDHMLDLFALVESFINKDRKVYEEFKSNAGLWESKLKFYY